VSILDPFCGSKWSNTTAQLQ